MKLQQKISYFTIVILLLSIGSITTLSYFQMKSLIKEQYSKDLLNVANAISENYIVKEYFSGNNSITNEQLNNEMEFVRIKTNTDFVVVLDMNDVRQSHPLKENVGKQFEGGDEKNALLKGEEYVSEAKGSLGTSFRAFTPVYINNVQVGVMCVGVLEVNFDYEIYTKMKRFIPFIVLGLTIGSLGAIILSYNIKKTIFGLEPEEIAMILKQKETVLENIKEGVISLDKEGKIILFNKEAGIILGLTDDCIGKHITELIKDSRVPEVLVNGEPLENVEVKIRPGISVMSKINPLKNDKNQVIGVVVNFRNLTELKKLAEELTGIKKMAWSLRAQNHEFMNKLHTISGLIQLEEYDEALQFIADVAKVRNKVSDILTKNIKDASLSALLLSKYNKAEECRVKLKIDKDSKLTKLPEYITSEEIVSLVGNLIENSLDVVKNDGTGEIYIKIFEEEDILYINVRDNGPGIPQQYWNKIYEQGFSTKEGQRGHGMYIVKKIIDECNGNIEFKVDKGVLWNITIPMIGGETVD